ncbi:MAG: hypothetical protein Q4G51_12460 [Dermatophilus congolensis]|nr:hypothetical protein [Dermatophilus congolensis]
MAPVVAALRAADLAIKATETVIVVLHVAAVDAGPGPTAVVARQVAKVDTPRVSAARIVVTPALASFLVSVGRTARARRGDQKVVGAVDAVVMIADSADDVTSDPTVSGTAAVRANAVLAIPARPLANGDSVGNALVSVGPGSLVNPSEGLVVVAAPSVVGTAGLVATVAGTHVMAGTVAADEMAGATADADSTTAETAMSKGATSRAA